MIDDRPVLSLADAGLRPRARFRGGGGDVFAARRLRGRRGDAAHRSLTLNEKHARLLALRRCGTPCAGALGRGAAPSHAAATTAPPRRVARS